ncbi:metallophosphoesterase [Desulfurobacterium sp.]
MIFFISDTHFYHRNIVNLSAFRFEGFENRILENLEKILTERDILYHLGDFTWHGKDKKGFLKRWQALPCRKVLVKGNHDEVTSSVLPIYFDEIIPFFKILDIRGKRLLLSHYPALDLRKKRRYIDRIRRVRWLFDFYRCDHLVHGHVHRNLAGIHCGCFLYGIKCFNVNLEFTGYRPVSVEEVIKLA